MADVGLPLFAKMVSHEGLHLGTLEEAFSWAHPDLLDNPELKEVSCLVECPSGSLSHAVDQLPLSLKFAGTEPMLVHFGLRVRRKDELDKLRFEFGILPIVLEHFQVLLKEHFGL